MGIGIYGNAFKAMIAPEAFIACFLQMQFGKTKKFLSICWTHPQENSCKQSDVFFRLAQLQ